MVDSATTGVKRSAVSALVVAETISVLGTRMTYLALPWFVLVTTGSPGKMSLVLAAEILPMAILGIPSGVRRPAARLADDDARRRPRARPDPRLDPASPRRGTPQLRPAARDRRAARLLHGAVLRGAADDPAGARRGGRDADVAGEQLDRGRKRASPRSSAPLLPARSSPSSARRTCCTSTPRPTSSPSC